MMHNLAFAYYKKNGNLQIRSSSMSPSVFFDLCDLVQGEIRTIDWREQWLSHD